MIHVQPKVELSAADMAAIQEVLSACEAADGRADLSFEKTLNHDKSAPSYFLAYAPEGGVDGRLVGLVSLFAPFPTETEISAFVHPDYRRKGVFKALLKAVEDLQAPGVDELFVCEADQVLGGRVALRLGAVKEFSEYAMAHPGTPEGQAILKAAVAAAPDLEVRPASLADLEALVALMSHGFKTEAGSEEALIRASLAGVTRKQYIAFGGRGGDRRPLGAGAISREGDDASIYGIVVDPEARGAGYGKALVASLALGIQAEGCRALIEVDSGNARAYHIYLGLGFVAERTVDYYRRKRA